MKAPDVIGIFHCSTCGKTSLEPIKPNHMRAGDFTRLCGGKVREGLYVPRSVHKRSVKSRQRDNDRPLTVRKGDCV